MSKQDHGIEHEPALYGVFDTGQDDSGSDSDSESKAARILARQRKRDAKRSFEHSVHDELAYLPRDQDESALIERDFHCNQCGYNLRGMRLGQPCPECLYVQYERPSATDRLGYAQWLTGRIEATPVAKTWGVVLAVFFLSGLWSVFGAFWHAGVGGLNGLFMVVLWAPIVEEVMKIALIAVVIERAPYLFSSRSQIIVAAIGAGLMFAIIENCLYLFVYVPGPPAWLVVWRWTICVALHVGCTLVAGVGAAIVWQKQMTQLRRLPVPVDIRYLFAAILIHGLYNGTAAVLELSGVF